MENRKSIFSRGVESLRDITLTRSRTSRVGKLRRRALRHCSAVRDELFQSPQAADYRAVTLKGNKKPLLLIASVCFLNPPNELPHNGRRKRHNFRARRRLRPSKKGDRSVKFNFPSFSVSVSHSTMTNTPRWRGNLARTLTNLTNRIARARPPWEVIKKRGTLCE